MEELTRLEERIMQCIWNYQGEVPFLDLIEMVKEKLNKDYKRTSIRGYLFRLEEKGYIKVTSLNCFLAHTRWTSISPPRLPRKTCLYC